MSLRSKTRYSREGIETNLDRFTNRIENRSIYKKIRNASINLKFFLLKIFVTKLIHFARKRKNNIRESKRNEFQFPRYEFSCKFITRTIRIFHQIRKDER